MVSFKRIYMKKGGENVILIKSIEEIIVFNMKLIKEEKELKLKKLLTKDKEMKYFIKKKIKKVKEFINMLKYILMVGDRALEYIYGRNFKYYDNKLK